MEGYLYDQGDEIIVRKANGGGVFAKIGTETVEVGDYTAYPVNASYKDLTENVSAVLCVYDGDNIILYPSEFQDDDTNYEGYPYMVTIKSSGLTIVLNGETADSPLYYFIQL